MGWRILVFGKVGAYAANVLKVPIEKLSRKAD